MLFRRARRLSDLGMAGIIAGLIAFALVSGPSPRAAERPGVAPEDPWTCPATHPIKGYVSHESGRRVYFLPGGRFYEEASPERCYATEDEARRDGSRPARDPRPLPPSGDIVSHPVSGPLSRGEDRRERGAEAEAPPLPDGRPAAQPVYHPRDAEHRAPGREGRQPARVDSFPAQSEGRKG